MRITVKEGDCIASIAERFGLHPDTIWNDPDNSKLKALRKDPNVLMPGDVVLVRKKEMKEVPISTGKRHQFRRKSYPEKLILSFLDDDGEPRANLEYVLEIDGQLLRGKTDASGKVEIWVPYDAKQGKLILGDTEEYDLDFGHLDPVTEDTGACARLINLGFLSSEDASDNEYRTAIEAFQEQYDLEMTGEMNEATRNKLLEVHGS